MSDQTTVQEMRDSLSRLLAQLAQARKNKKAFSANSEAMLKTVTEREDYKAILALLGEAKEDEELFTKAIRALVEKIYIAEGKTSKNVHEWASVSIEKEFVVTDPDLMVAWVKEKLSAAVTVSIDEGMVKDHALKHGGVPGVQFEEKIKVKIASKL